MGPPNDSSVGTNGSNNYGLWYLSLITIVNGIYKPTYSWRRPALQKVEPTKLHTPGESLVQYWIILIFLFQGSIERNLIKWLVPKWGDFLPTFVVMQWWGKYGKASWFGTFVIFPYLGNNHPNWRTHIFQRGRSTTNQLFSHEMEWRTNPKSLVTAYSVQFLAQGVWSFGGVSCAGRLYTLFDSV